MAEIPGAQARQCGSKKIQPDLQSAKAEAKRLTKLIAGAKHTAYECGWCGGFHVGRDRSPQAAKKRWERKMGANA